MVPQEMIAGLPEMYAIYMICLLKAEPGTMDASLLSMQKGYTRIRHGKNIFQRA